MRWMRRTASFGCWPDNRQRMLLGAAVWGDERARVAWNRWSTGITREQVGWSDMRLLAGAYRPLRNLGIDDPLLVLAGGVYRRTWYTNHVMLRRASAAIAQLRAGGVETLMLKGAALAILHYRDLGARPMEDVDLLVDPARLQAAVRVLSAGDWQLLPTQGAGNGPLAYGTHVKDAGGNEIDIHAYALMQSVDDADLWESSVPIDVLGTATRSLAPAEQLLHVCAHGLRWDERTTVRWAADAMAILRMAGTALDWERLVQCTQARRLTVVVGQALAWLRESLEADVPEDVLRRLRAGPRLRFERAIHARSMRRPTPLSLALMTADRYRRFAKLAPVESRPESFMRFLQSSWELDSPRRLLVHGGLKLAGRTQQ